MAEPIERDGAFYHRVRVPLDIVATFEKTRTGKPRTEIWIPLPGRTRAEARRKLGWAMEEAQRRFDAHRVTLNGSNAAAVVEPAKSPRLVCAAFYEQLQEHERRRRREIVKEAKVNPPYFWSGNMLPLPTVKERGLDGFHGVLAKAFAMHVTSRLNDAKGALAIMDMHHVVRWLAVMDKLYGSNWTDETDEALLPLLARTEIAFLEALLRDPGALFGPMPPLGTISLTSVHVGLQVAPADTPRLSEAAKKWRSIKVREGWTDARMLPLLDTSVALLIEVCGDKALSAYGKSHVTEFKDVLSRLPKHRLKNPKTKNLDAREAADLGLPA